jgi:hypothetical protein
MLFQPRCAAVFEVCRRQQNEQCVRIKTLQPLRECVDLEERIQNI